MKHLTPADYTTMPWANGKGVTVEMLRVEGPVGLQWRLSRASVVENGAFSIFAGIERNLTVISGPGFELHGQGVYLQAKPLAPVAFSGEIAVRAEAVQSASDDFNVMTARGLPLPEVLVLKQPTRMSQGGMLALFALEPAQVNGRAMGRYDLVLTEAAAETTGLMIAVRLYA